MKQRESTAKRECSGRQKRSESVEKAEAEGKCIIVQRKTDAKGECIKGRVQRRKKEAKRERSKGRRSQRESRVQECRRGRQKLWESA